MELAKVTSKGQITIPIDVRKRYGLREGSRVSVLEEDGKLYLMNSTMAAFREAQAAFSCIAEASGIDTEEDAVDMAKRFRKERGTEK